MPRSYSTCFLGILIGFFFTAESMAQVSVVSTVRPLQFISQAILLDGDQSYAIENDSHAAHSITLSPQDRIQLSNADLVLRISDQFEIYLSEVLQTSTSDHSTITAVDIPGLTLHSQPNGELDPHLWLDPDNARLIAARLTAELVKIAPNKAAAYQSRLDAFETRLQAQWQNLELGNAAEVSYAVYHDAYQYIEAPMGLSPAVVLLDNPEVEPGMRDVIAKRQQLEAADPQCILLEPESEQGMVDTMLQTLAPKRITIDILGATIEEGDSAYLNLLNHVTEGFSNCMSAD